MTATMNDQTLPQVVLPYSEAEVPPPAYNESTNQHSSLDKKSFSPKDEKKQQSIDIDVRSVSSNTTTTSHAFTLADFSSTLLPNTPFTPGPTFHISARGIGMLRFPVPSSELEIDIYNPDSTVAYTSTRARRSKGDCILASPTRGDLISTNYFFGPTRQPAIKDLSLNPLNPANDATDYKTQQLDSLFEIKSKCIRSRAITLIHRPTGKVYEWSYDKLKTADGEKTNLLVLRLITPSGYLTSDNKKEGKVLAQLIRSESTRTPGSSSCSAGNGGQLVLEEHADEVLKEEVIVATCLMMLKKEIDRRRTIQIMILAGAASGGGN